MSLGIVKETIGKRCPLLSRLMMVALALILASNLAQAAVERVTDYEYDNAGNIVRIVSQEQTAPPTVSLLTPNFINIGRTVSFTATGSNLLNVDVTTAVPGLNASEVISSSNQVTFKLTASPTTAIGNAIIRFTTGIGEAQETIFVAEARPDLTPDPNPIAIEYNNVTTSINLIFSQPRPENETYTLSTNDAGIADTVAGAFSILAGESQVDITLTGFAIGSTTLNIDLAEKFYSYSFPVFVSKSYAELLTEFPDMGQRNIFSNAVGIFVRSDSPFPPNAVLSSPVGVLVDSRGAFFSEAVGVFFGDGFRGSIFSQPVGVTLSDSDSIFSPAVGVNVSDNLGFAYSPQVESIYGPLLDDLQPPTVAVDTVINFGVTGFNLGEVTVVSVSPPEDIVLDAFTVNPEGTLLMLPTTISLTAVLGTREIILESATGVIDTRSGAALTFEIQ